VYASGDGGFDVNVVCRTKDTDILDRTKTAMDAPGAYKSQGKGRVLSVLGCSQGPCVPGSGLAFAGNASGSNRAEQEGPREGNASARGNFNKRSFHGGVYVGRHVCACAAVVSC
jgi:hypothetical protein